MSNMDAPEDKIKIVFELFKICRSLEEHENDLINHRTTWFILINTIFMATFGFSIQKLYEVYEKSPTDITGKLKVFSLETFGFLSFLLLICLAGFITSIMGFFSIKAATNAQEGVRNLWTSESKKYPNIWLPPLAGGGEQAFFVRYFGSTFARYIVYLFSIIWFITGGGICVEIFIYMKTLH